MSTINQQHQLHLMDNPPTLSKSSSTLSIKTQLSLDGGNSIPTTTAKDEPIVEEARQDTTVAIESREEPPSKRVVDCAAASSPREDTASISTVDRYDTTTPPTTEPTIVAATSTTKVNEEDNAGATTSDSLAHTETNNLASILINTTTSAESASVKTEEDIKTVGSSASNKSKKSLKSLDSNTSKSIKTQEAAEEEKSSVATATNTMPSKEVMDGIVEGMVESLAVTMLTHSKCKEDEGEVLPAADIKDTPNDDPKDEEKEESSIPWGDDTSAAVKKVEEETKETAVEGEKSGVVAGFMSMLTPSKKKEEAPHDDETPPPVVEEGTIKKDNSTEENSTDLLNASVEIGSSGEVLNEDNQTDTTGEQQLQTLFSQINFSKKKQIKLIEQYVGREEILISHLTKYLANKNKSQGEEDDGEAVKKKKEEEEVNDDQEESSEYQELEKTLTQDEAEYLATASVEVDIQDTVSGSKSVVGEEEIDEQPSESVEIEPPSFVLKDERPAVLSTVNDTSLPTKEIKSTTPKSQGKKKKKSTRFSLRTAVSKTKRNLVGKIKKKMKKKSSSSKGTKSSINVVPVSPTSAVNAYDTLYGRSQGNGKLSSVAEESRSGSPGVDLEIINGDIIEVGEEGGEEEVINETSDTTPSKTPVGVVAEDTMKEEENTPEVKEEDTTTVATESIATQSVGNNSKGSATSGTTSVAQTMASMFGLSPTKAAAVTTEPEEKFVTSEKSVDKPIEEKSNDSEVAAPSFVASMFGLRSSSPKPEEKVEEKPIEEVKKEEITIPSLGEDATKSIETDGPPSEETVAVDPATIPLPKSDSVSLAVTEEATADNSTADPDMKEANKVNETELQVPSTMVSAEDVKLDKSESMSLQEVAEGTVTGVDEEPKTRKLPKEDEFPGPPSLFFKEQGIELHANFKEGSDTRVKSAKPRETIPEEGWTELLDDEVKQSSSFTTIKLTKSSKSKKQKKKDKKNRTKSPIIEEAAEDTELDTSPIEQKGVVENTTPLTSEESPQPTARKQRVKTKSMKKLRMGLMKSSDRTPPTPPTTASEDTGAAKKDDDKAELEQAVQEYKELQAVSVDKRKLATEQASKNEASEEKLTKEEKALKKAKRKEKDFPSKKNKTKRRELQQKISALESDLELATTELAQMEQEADRAESEALDAKKEAHRLKDKRKMAQAEGRTSPMKLNTGRTSPMKLTMSKAKKRVTQKSPVKELLMSPRSTSPQETFEEFKKTVVDNAASLDGSENLNSNSYDDDESTNKASYDGTGSLLSGRESYVSEYTRESTVITSDRVVDDEPSGTCNAEDVLEDLVLGISGACCIPVVLADAMLCNEYTTAEEEAEKKREARKLLKKKKKMKQRHRK